MITPQMIFYPYSFLRMVIQNLTKVEISDFDNWIKLKQKANILGSNDSSTNKNSNSKTYFNGAVIGYDNTTNDILSLQFFEDSNLKPNKKRIKNILGNRFGNTNIGHNYDGNRNNFKIKSFEFECPAASGISKIETLNQG